MDVSPLLPLCDGLVVKRVESTATTVAVTVASTALIACCPLCQHPSEHVHGHYQRVVADLPCGGRQMMLHLVVRKFVCLNLACPRVIFAERLPDLVLPRARQTLRLSIALRSLGFATSGEAGARLARQLGMPMSPATLLRRLKATPARAEEPVTKVAIDDFALRRGCRYGTILINLETHRVVDLLPDRTVATVRAWFQARPQIDTISRDRGPDYARAAREGAPQATQVADRWHVLRNLNEAVAMILTRHQPRHSQSIAGRGSSSPAKARATPERRSEFQPAAPPAPSAGTSAGQLRFLAPRGALRRSKGKQE